MEYLAIILALAIIGYYGYGYSKFLKFKKELKRKYPATKDVPFYGPSILSFVGLTVVAGLIAWWFERSPINSALAIVLMGYFIGNAIGSLSNYIIFLTNEGFYLDQTFFYYHDIEKADKPKANKIKITLKSGHHFIIAAQIGKLLLRNKQLVENKQTSS